MRPIMDITKELSIYNIESFNIDSNNIGFRLVDDPQTVLKIKYPISVFDGVNLIRAELDKDKYASDIMLVVKNSIRAELDQMDKEQYAKKLTYEKLEKNGWNDDVFGPDVVNYNSKPWIGTDGSSNDVYLILYRSLPLDRTSCLVLDITDLLDREIKAVLDLMDDSEPPYDTELAELLYLEPTTKNIMSKAHDRGQLRTFEISRIRVRFGPSAFLSLEEVNQLIENNPHVDVNKYVSEPALDDKQPFTTDADKHRFNCLVERIAKNTRPLTWFEKLYMRVMDFAGGCGLISNEELMPVQLDEQYNKYKPKQIRKTLLENLDCFDKNGEVKKVTLLDGTQANQVSIPRRKYGMNTYIDIERVLARHLLLKGKI